jgi:hypothetical protein
LHHAHRTRASRGKFPPRGVTNGTTPKALVGGGGIVSANITDGNISNSVDESETSAANLDSPLGTTYGHVVAYMSDDSAPAHLSADGTSVCSGWSQLAVSYDLSVGFPTSFTGTVHPAIRIPPPTTAVQLLYSDPGVTVEQDTLPTSHTSWTVFVSSLAISNMAWTTKAMQLQTRAGGMASCVAASEVAALVDQVCVTAVNIPKMGGTPSIGNQWCVGQPGNTLRYDGPAITNFNGSVFVAATADDAQRVDVWANSTSLVGTGTPLENPFPAASIVGHARFASNFWNFPTLVAPDQNEVFSVASYNCAFSQSCLIPAFSVGNQQLVGYTGNLTVSVGSNTVREIGFDALAYGTPFFSRSIWLFYSQFDPLHGVMRVYGTLCSINDHTPSLSSCQNAGALTPSQNNAFSPAAAVNDGTLNDSWLSYWSDSAGGGRLQMVAARVNVTTGALTNHNLVNVVETPCPSTGNYWGDYDSLIISNIGSSSPSLLRYVTDSTDGTCNAGFPQHVSVAFGNGAL